MKKLLFIAKLVFITAVFIYAALKFDPEVARDVLAAARPGWALLAVVCYFAGYLLITYRWAMIIRGFWQERQPVPTRRLFFFNILAVFYTLFIPTSIAGEAVRTVKLSREVNNDYPRSLVAVVLDRLLGMVLWATLFLASPTPFPRVKFWLIPLFALPAFFLFRKKVNFWGHRVFDFSRHHPADIAKSVIFSLTGQLFIILGTHFIFLCFAVPISFLQSVAVVSTATMTGIVPLTLLGVGMREASFLGLLPLYGASSTQAFLALTLTVTMNYIFGLSGGVVELARMGWKFSRLKEEAREEVSAAERWEEKVASPEGTLRPTEKDAGPGA